MWCLAALCDVDNYRVDDKFHVNFGREVTENLFDVAGRAALCHAVHYELWKGHVAVVVVIEGNICST